jgi:hypothetical protein
LQGWRRAGRKAWTALQNTWRADRAGLARTGYRALCECVSQLPVHRYSIHCRKSAERRIVS